MRNEYLYKVAGLLFSVSLPEDWDVERLLPSFRPFRCGDCEEGHIFRLLVTTLPFKAGGTSVELLGESSNDMGHVRLSRRTDDYQVEISYGTVEDGVHVMIADRLFACATAYLRPDDPNVGTALLSMLRVLYAQAVLGQDGVSIHASCVSLRGKSYLFLGKSGMGKSTHARQWMKAFSDCCLLNDDNPVLRMDGDTLVAYGTPWSGKTPCYKDEHYPVEGIARLRQAGTNRFIPLAETEAFAALLPSCSAIRQDVHLQDALYHTLIRISEQIPIGLLECRPEVEAARLCFENLSTESNHKKHNTK